MKKIVGVKFRHTGKSFYYDANDLDLVVGSGVIVKSEDGNEYGTVSVPPVEKEDDELPSILKQIVRKATEEDDKRLAENNDKEKEAYIIGKEKIAELNLPMKLIQAEYTFDRNKLLFYFSAEGRVDFRELVRVLAAVFKTRIELRQIGVRDEAKMLGGIGICGRPLCCSTYLSDFAPVSIKMAKEQNLSLNPTKISGLCGRLMCCLGHEEETYEYLNKTMPRNGDFAVNIEGNVGVIRSVNILKQTVLVMFEEGDTREMKEYSIEEICVGPRREGVPSDARIAAFKEQLQNKFDTTEVTETKKPAKVNTKSEEKPKENTKEPAVDKTTKNQNKERKSNDNRNKNDANSQKREKQKSKPANKSEENENKRVNNPNKKKDNFKKNKNQNNKKRNNKKPNNNQQDRQPEKKKDNQDNNNKGKLSKDKKNKQNNKNRQKKFGNNQNKQENKTRRNGGYNRGYRGDREE